MSRKSIYLSKKSLKHSSHEQYLKDQWPAIVLEKKPLVFFIYMCYFCFGDDRKWYIQGVLQREMQNELIKIGMKKVKEI